MKIMRILLSFICAATLLFVGCDGKNDDGGVKVTGLSLTDEKQEVVTMPYNSAPVTVGITTDAPKEAISVKQLPVAGEPTASWCVVTVNSNSEITVAPGQNSGTTQRKATFEVTAGTYKVTFAVRQEFKEPENPTLEIDLVAEWGSYFLATAPDQIAKEITVTTNCNSWSAEVSYMMDGAEYVTLVQSSGLTGDKLKFTIPENTTPDMRSGAVITITAGSADPIDINVSQNPKWATAVAVMDADWENVLPTNQVVSFAASSSGSSKKKSFDLDTDAAGHGYFDVKIVNAGTSVVTTETWLDAAYGYSGTLNIYPKNANTAAAASSLDVIFTAKAGIELFRFKVTQEGTAN